MGRRTGELFCGTIAPPGRGKGDGRSQGIRSAYRKKTNAPPAPPHLDPAKDRRAQNAHRVLREGVENRNKSAMLQAGRGKQEPMLDMLAQTFWTGKRESFYRSDPNHAGAGRSNKSYRSSKPAE